MVDLNLPLKIPVEAFGLDYRKDDVNPYMTRKLLKKKIEASGRKVIQSENFETQLLIEFIRRYKHLDNYIKVKIGEFRPNPRIEEHNKEVLEILDWEKVERLLFICRVCSFIGDPSFPDFIVCGSEKDTPELKYVYTGDELIPDRIVFILLAKALCLGEIKLAALDFSDYKQPDFVEADLLEPLKKAMESISSRVNVERSFEDVGVDFKVLKEIIDSGKLNGEKVLELYKKFMEKASQDNRTRQLLKKLEESGLELIGEQAEKLTILRERLEINMMEAHDVLNLYNITKG